MALAALRHGDSHIAGAAVRYNLLEFGELFLFLLAVMTYTNAMEERGVFNALRGGWLREVISMRAIYWITGFLAFIISPIADNQTNALLMATVMMSVSRDNKESVSYTHLTQPTKA